MIIIITTDIPAECILKVIHGGGLYDDGHIDGAAEFLQGF